MVCIYCSSKTKVTNSRGAAGTASIWRRRQCLACGSIVTTYESPDYSTALRVQNVQKTLKPFSRDKLLISLHTSLGHRQNALEDASGLCETIVQQLAREHHNGLLTNSLLATSAHQVLQRFDTVAGTVYAARHKSVN